MNRPAWNKLPSAGAAIAVGAICVPLAGIGSEYLSRERSSNLLVFLWFMGVFVIPVLVSTFDVRRWWTDLRTNGLIRGGLSMTEKNLHEFYFPAWGRLLLFFLSGVGATLLASFLRR